MARSRVTGRHSGNDDGYHSETPAPTVGKEVKPLKALASVAAGETATNFKNPPPPPHEAPLLRGHSGTARGHATGNMAANLCKSDQIRAL
jgi:hypothetical protein